MISEKYDPKSIEGKWQEIWNVRRVFEAPDPKNDSRNRPKYYCLCMFPYPSGAIHMGHVRNYSIGDAISRYKRMKGFNVLQPIGWDAFGLPAENAAISRGVHPKDWTLLNISQMKRELQSMGIAYDWSRELTTCLPEYYKWEQMLFGRFFNEGLAYKKTGILNWCESCETVLANEQVHDNRCWRCDGEVTQKEMSQWYLKITHYSNELLQGHEELKAGWPERVLDMQKHWIGASKGVLIQFAVEGRKSILEVFTTRADTLFGVTFLTIAPGHPLAKDLCSHPEAKTKLEILLKQGQAKKSTELTSKEGFFTGSYCLHPLTEKRVPIWVGDFVVMDYGTGAVMAVPAHDQRDFEFAKKFNLPIKRVIIPSKTDAMDATLTQAFEEPGILVESESFSNLDSETAKEKLAEYIAKRKRGGATTQYRLRDWGISRQRYWGTPIPIVYCDACGVVVVPDSELPVELPTDVKFTGRGGNPLEHHEKFTQTVCPTCKRPARRETDTMDTFVESSWYYARFASPCYKENIFLKDAVDSWLPVDHYIGGIEHACMHLLYARFFHKILRDWGYLKGNEPFSRLLSQGMVIKDGAKMSKSKGNVVTPTAIIDAYGADTARLFSLFAAPPEKDLDWNEKGVEGCQRFLGRVWRLFHQYGESLRQNPSEPKAPLSESLLKIRRKTHWMISKMSDDLESSKFNTAIAAAMELVNELYLGSEGRVFGTEAGKFVLKEAIRNLVLCLTPFSPHFCEELWAAMGSKTLIADEAWPKHSPELLQENNFLLIVQVNGKVREKIELPKSLPKEEIEKRVLALPKLVPFIEGKRVVQFIYVPLRLANVVTA